MKKLLTLVAAAACATAYSSSWHEAYHGGDTGDLPGTAHVTQGSAGLTQLIGSCGVGDDVDMYKIKIVNTGTFSASTVGGAGYDTMVWVFDSTGKGVSMNDDATGLQSTVDNSLITSTGDYYIAISRYARAPTGAGGALWTTYGSGGASTAPDGPGALDPVTGWTSATTSGGAYTIFLAGCDPSVIGADETLPSPPANSWVEESSEYSGSHGDAGELIGTAQMTSGSGLVLQIFGRINSSTDTDLFCVKITDPANFSATTVNVETGIDTQLWLFNADGTGIVMDDDEVGGTTLQSRLSNAFTGSLTVGGTYYLAVSTFDRDAMDASAQQIWLDLVGGSYRVEHAPDDLGAANPLDSWDNGGGTPAAGAYRINLTGCSYCAGGEVTIAPTTLTPGPGSSLGGGVAEISTSNDAYYLMRPGAILVATADPLVLVASGTAPGATASSLKAQVEVRSTASNMRQIVEARNFVTNSYDILETFVGTFTAADRTVTLTIPNPNDHIGPGNEVRLRLRYKNQSGVLVYPWQIKFDEVTWRYTP